MSFRVIRNSVGLLEALSLSLFPLSIFNYLVGLEKKKERKEKAADLASLALNILGHIHNMN